MHTHVYNYKLYSRKPGGLMHAQVDNEKGWQNSCTVSHNGISDSGNPLDLVKYRSGRRRIGEEVDLTCLQKRKLCCWQRKSDRAAVISVNWLLLCKLNALKHKRALQTITKFAFVNSHWPTLLVGQVQRLIHINSRHAIFNSPQQDIIEGELGIESISQVYYQSQTFASFVCVHCSYCY